MTARQYAINAIEELSQKTSDGLTRESVYLIEQYIQSAILAERERIETERKNQILAEASQDARNMAAIVRDAILAEREACISICDYIEKEAASLILNPDSDEGSKQYEKGKGLCAARVRAKIRARSNAPESPNKPLESSENLQSSTFPASAMKTCS